MKRFLFVVCLTLASASTGMAQTRTIPLPRIPTPPVTMPVTLPPSVSVNPGAVLPTASSAQNTIQQSLLQNLPPGVTASINTAMNLSSSLSSSSLQQAAMNTITSALSSYLPSGFTDAFSALRNIISTVTSVQNAASAGMPSLASITPTVQLPTATLPTVPTVPTANSITAQATTAFRRAETQNFRLVANELARVRRQAMNQARQIGTSMGFSGAAMQSLINSCTSEPNNCQSAATAIATRYATQRALNQVTASNTPFALKRIIYACALGSSKKCQDTAERKVLGEVAKGISTGLSNALGMRVHISAQGYASFITRSDSSERNGDIVSARRRGVVITNTYVSRTDTGVIQF